MAQTPVLLVFLCHCPSRDTRQPSSLCQCPWITTLGKFTVCHLITHECLFAGSLSQLVVTQFPSFSASLGSSTRLTCTLSSGSNVGIYDSDKHQGSGVPSRFSGSKDASANAGLLRISGLQAEAEADYHWAAAQGGGSETKTPVQTNHDSEVILSKKLTQRHMQGGSSAERSVLEQGKEKHTGYVCNTPGAMVDYGSGWDKSGSTCAHPAILSVTISRKQNPHQQETLETSSVTGVLSSGQQGWALNT
ncbi:hypothetical protein GH733_005396 [Mirounga leonina]|nr:hypothetical protein GH733_005396 [Mirounga leonina]